MLRQKGHFVILMSVLSFFVCFDQLYGSKTETVTVDGYIRIEDDEEESQKNLVDQLKLKAISQCLEKLNIRKKGIEYFGDKMLKDNLDYAIKSHKILTSKTNKKNLSLKVQVVFDTEELRSQAEAIGAFLKKDDILLYVYIVEKINNKPGKVAQQYISDYFIKKGFHIPGFIDQAKILINGQAFVERSDKLSVYDEETKILSSKVVITYDIFHKSGEKIHSGKVEEAGIHVTSKSSVIKALTKAAHQVSEDSFDEIISYMKKRVNNK